ncbi:MAG: polymer-forming cytoskeletal protein [Myxococcota bacterium]
MTDSSPPRDRARERLLTVGADVRIRGEVQTAHDVWVLGRLEGSLRSGGTVTIPESGSLDAEVEAERIVVQGKARGRLAARRAIEVLATAEVEAELFAPEVALADGAIFSGSIETGEGGRRG